MLLHLNVVMSRHYNFSCFNGVKSFYSPNKIFYGGTFLSSWLAENMPILQLSRKYASPVLIAEEEVSMRDACKGRFTFRFSSGF